MSSLMLALNLETCLSLACELFTAKNCTFYFSASTHTCLSAQQAVSHREMPRLCLVFSEFPKRQSSGLLLVSEGVQRPLISFPQQCLVGEGSEMTMLIVCILQIEKLRPRKVIALLKTTVALKGEQRFALRSTDSRP